MQKQRYQSTPKTPTTALDDVDLMETVAGNTSSRELQSVEDQDEIVFLDDGAPYEYSSDSFRTAPFQNGSVLTDTQSVSWLEGHKLADNDQWVLEAHTVAWSGRFNDNHVHNVEHMGPMAVEEAARMAFSYENKRRFSDAYYTVPADELSGHDSFQYLKNTPDLTSFANDKTIVLDESALKEAEVDSVIENMDQYKKLHEALIALEDFDNRMARNIVDRGRFADDTDNYFYFFMFSAVGVCLSALPGVIASETTNSNTLVLAAVMATLALEAAGAAYGVRRYLYPERYVAGELDRRLNSLPGKELSGMAREFTKAARGVMHLELAAGNLKMYTEKPNSIFANSRFKRGLKNIEKAAKADPSLDEKSLKVQFIRGTFPEPGSFKDGLEQQRLALKQALEKALGQDAPQSATSDENKIVSPGLLGPPG